MTRQPALAALITTWNASFSSPLDTTYLVSLLEAGTPVGQAVAEYNSSPLALRTGDRLCLVGDPEYRFEPVRARPPREHRRRHSPPPGRVRTETASQADFLRSYLMWSERFSPADSEAELEDPLEEMERLGSASTEAAAARSRRRIAMVIASRATLTCKTWCPFAEPNGVIRDSGPCPCCGEASLRIYFAVSGAPGMRRRVGSCPRCGIFEDAEAESPVISVAIDARSVRFVLKGPVEPWFAALRIEHAELSEGSTLFTEGTAGSECEVEFKLPDPLPAAAIFLTLFILDGLRFTSARVPLPRDHPWVGNFQREHLGRRERDDFE